MDGRLIIFLGSLAIYIPLAGILLYVWWKHGKDDSAVMLARIIFLFGSFGLFIYMMTL
jgi:hypothetical protein